MSTHKRPQALLVGTACLGALLLWQLWLAVMALPSGKSGIWTGLAVAVVSLVIPAGLLLLKRWAFLFALLAAMVLMFDALLAFTELNHYRERIGFDSLVATAGILGLKVVLCAVCMISLTTPSARHAFEHHH